MSHSATRTYSLDRIKEQFSSLSGLKMTGSSRQGAASLGFSDEEIMNAIQALGDSDFYKSMAPTSPGFINWQDVYKSHFRDVELYIKFQLAKSGELFILLSFKEK